MSSPVRSYADVVRGANPPSFDQLTAGFSSLSFNYGLVTADNRTKLSQASSNLLKEYLRFEPDDAKEQSSCRSIFRIVQDKWESRLYIKHGWFVTFSRDQIMNAVKRDRISDAGFMIIESNRQGAVYMLMCILLDSSGDLAGFIPLTMCTDANRQELVDRISPWLRVENDHEKDFYI